MTACVVYINGLMTLSENVFNTLGYLPKDQFINVNTFSTKWRQRLSLLQVITGIALYIIGTLAEYLNHQTDPQKYLTLAQQTLSLGLLYINHGVFNFLRGFVERQNYGSVITGAYDFYGRKFLPALSNPFDIQSRIFSYIRQQLDRIHFVTLFPPKICFRT